MYVRQTTRTILGAALICSSTCFTTTNNMLVSRTANQFRHVSRLVCDAAAPAEPEMDGLQTRHVLFKGMDLPVSHGETLRTALLKTGKATPHNGQSQMINCRGLGTCGTCAVEIVGNVSPSTWTQQERLRLNFPPHSAPGNKKLRLACQVITECKFLSLSAVSSASAPFCSHLIHSRVGICAF